jgi:hypothetical protein
MHSQVLLICSFLAANSVTALPLNINLGAYSPALVVGDGEISFGGKADVSNLMNALEGAAVSGAAANAAAPAAAAPAAGQPSAAPKAAAVEQPAVQPASQAEVAPIVPDQQQAAQIASLQGMGKEIAPRVVTMSANENVEKRDINGFNAALKYATGALTTGPKVQLGTGEGGSGVGITQDAGGAKPAAAAAQPAAQQPAAAKRDEITPKLKTTVTTMFVRGGPAPAGTFPMTY